MTKDYTTYLIEYTDTFGGEARYSWVKVFEVVLPVDISDSLLKHIAKELAGLQGARGRWETLDELLKFIPANSNTVLFITWE